MNKLRWKIALLVGGTVLLTLLIIMGAFNLIMQRRMKNNAEESIRSVLMGTDEEGQANGLYSPELLPVFETDEEKEKATQIYTQKERSIIQWCDGKQPDVLFRTEIDGSDYYLMLVTSELLMQSSLATGENSMFTGNGILSFFHFGTIDEYSWVSSTDDLENPMDDFDITAFGMTTGLRVVIGYIDITGELEMIRHINIVFLIAAFVIGAFGCTMGYFIGKKLEQNQLAQKQFFENTSHELKTPLTSIRGYAEGIEKGIITDYPHTGSVIAAQTEKMSRLVEEILCMAKLESGSVTLQKESLEMQEFVQDCLMPFEGTVLNRGLTVKLDLHPMRVSADPDKLEHAISNLLTNALKYAQTYIRISCGEGMLCIANDCAALTDDTLAHLFERFYSGRDGNTGIGLSLAKDLIELHGWSLIAKRTEDGICFEVRCASGRRAGKKSEKDIAVQ